MPQRALKKIGKERNWELTNLLWAAGNLSKSNQTVKKGLKSTVADIGLNGGNVGLMEFRL